MAEKPSVISIFIGSSQELSLDQRGLADFFAEVNKVSVPRGAFFRLVPWQWDGRNDPVKDYAELVRESELVLFLFFTAGDLSMEERFDQALEAFRSKGRPQIVTWFKAVPEGGSVSDELEGFRQRLDTELHHFYSTYETLDTVKLGTLFQIIRDLPGARALGGGGSAPGAAPGSDSAVPGPAPGAITIEEDRALLWGVPVVDLENVPAYRDWGNIREARAELAEVKAECRRLEGEFSEHPNDEDVARELARARVRRMELVRAIRDGQQKFLDFMEEMSRANTHALTDRQREAYRLAESGRADDAIALLDDGQIEQERSIAEGDLAMLDALRSEALARIRSTISEQIQLALLLKSRPWTPELRERVLALLTDAAACEARHGLGIRAQLELGSFLLDMGRGAEAIPYLEQAVEAARDTQEERSYADEVEAIITQTELGRAYLGQGAWDEAIGVADALLASPEAMSAGARPFEADALAMKSDALAGKGLLEEAVAALAEAIPIYEGSPVWLYDLASSCNKLGTLLMSMGERSRALEAYDRGVDAARELIVERSEDELEWLLAQSLANKAMALRGLARLEEALEAAEEAVSIMRDLDERRPGVYSGMLCDILTQCGNVNLSLERFEGAEALYRESVRLARELFEFDLAHSRESLALALGNLSTTIALQSKDPEEVEALAAEAVELWRPLFEEDSCGYAKNYSSALCALAEACAALGRADEAEELFRKAVAVMRRAAELQPFAHDDALSNRLFRLAQFIDASHPDEADDLFEEQRAVLAAAAVAGKGELAAAFADATNDLGCRASRKGDSKRALREFSTAERVYRTVAKEREGSDGIESLARCLANLAFEYKRVGDALRALSKIEESVELTRELAEKDPERYGSTLENRLKRLESCRKLAGSEILTEGREGEKGSRRPGGLEGWSVI